jgi:rSAM/selenodomain-associated transferase 1
MPFAKRADPLDNNGSMNIAYRVLDPSRPDQVPKGLCALAVMTKAPRAGQVKTRLTPPLTAEEAAALNSCFLRDTTTAIKNATRNGAARGIAVYTPVGDESAYAGILPAEFQLVGQRGEAFGERLVSALEDLFRLGFESVCLIDSDSPTVPQRAFTEAVTILAQKDAPVVLGPSEDGGYYLIGLKKLNRALFEDIAWSAERVLEQTLERAGEMNLKVHLLPRWYDVDDRGTLRRLCEEFFVANGRQTGGYPAPATRGYLEELLNREGRNRIWPPDSHL